MVNFKQEEKPHGDTHGSLVRPIHKTVWINEIGKKCCQVKRQQAAINIHVSYNLFAKRAQAVIYRTTVARNSLRLEK